MGLSSFNRQRRLKADVAKKEAERFEAWNEARHAARDHLTGHKADDHTAQLEARQLEADAVKAIGEANREGLDNGDLPMRKEHAAEIAGRTVIDPQGEDAPSPTEKVDLRLPHGTANEELVEHTDVRKDGPSAELVEAAQKEAGVLPDEERAERERASDQTKPENVATPEEREPLIPTVHDEIARETAPEPGNEGTPEETGPSGVVEPEHSADETVPAAEPTLSDETAPEAENTSDAATDEAEPRTAQSLTDETAESRSKVEIIDAWEHLEWPAKRSLASQLTDEPVTNKAKAEEVIKAELDRRRASK